MEAVLKLEHIEKYYGNKGELVKALDDVSFTVEEREFIGIMGASGSGKTTLLNCVSTIDTVSGGHVYLNGRDLTEIRDRELARFRRGKLGFIFQEFNLLDTLTIRENIALAMTISRKSVREIETGVSSIAERLGIDDILDRYPNEVSGGQKQRCACARAMVNHPALILADEPAGALDSNSCRILLATLQKMNTDLHATILMVTHDAFCASCTKRILFLRDGAVFCELWRGEKTRKEFFNEILDVMSLLGGDFTDVR